MSETNLATIQLKDVTQEFVLNKKDFKTGSRRYHAQGKMQVGDKRYQCNILVVEIDSKPKINKTTTLLWAQTFLK
jgi:hypothetical protein